MSKKEEENAAINEDEEYLEQETLEIIEAIEDSQLDNPSLEEAKKWIQKIGLKKGALHRQLGIPADKKIPLSVLKKAAKAKGKLGARARLALKFRTFKHTETFDPEQMLAMVKEAIADPPEGVKNEEQKNKEKKADDAEKQEPDGRQAEVDLNKAQETGVSVEPTTEVEGDAVVTSGKPKKVQEESLKERLNRWKKRSIINDDKIRDHLARLGEILRDEDARLKREIDEMKGSLTDLQAKQSAIDARVTKIDAGFGANIAEVKKELVGLLQSVQEETKKFVDMTDQRFEERGDQLDQMKKENTNLKETVGKLTGTLTEAEQKRTELVTKLEETAKLTEDVHGRLMDKKAVQNIPFKGEPPEIEDIKETEEKLGIEDWQWENFKNRIRKR